MRERERERERKRVCGASISTVTLVPRCGTCLPRPSFSHFFSFLLPFPQCVCVCVRVGCAHDYRETFIPFSSCYSSSTCSPYYDRGHRCRFPVFYSLLLFSRNFSFDVLLIYIDTSSASAVSFTLYRESTSFFAFSYPSACV